MIKELTIAFENCESMTFNGNVIGEFEIRDIQTVIRRIASNSIDKYQIADTVFFELFAEGNTEYDPFGIEKERTTAFDRLQKYMDITSIEITYEDGTTDEIYVDYNTNGHCGLGADNVNQTVYLSRLGNIYVLISENKKIEYFVNLESIEDKETVDFRKDMYNIGDVKYEEQPLTVDNLPDFYRYVQLTEQYGKEKYEVNYIVAVRVPYVDKYGNNRWRFIYEPSCEQSFYTYVNPKWKYYSDKVSDFVEERHRRVGDGFTISELKEKYPLPPEK